MYQLHHSRIRTPMTPAASYPSMVAFVVSGGSEIGTSDITSRYMVEYMYR
eukprot:COSAG02_NODE_50510_length_320_cov_0.674208_1_plen_49_part_10